MSLPLLKVEGGFWEVVKGVLDLWLGWHIWLWLIVILLGLSGLWGFWGLWLLWLGLLWLLLLCWWLESSLSLGQLRGTVVKDRSELGVVDDSLEVSDDVGEFLSGRLVNETGEGVLESRDDKDIGNGDSLADEVSLAQQDLVKGVESGEELVVDGGEGWLGVGDSASDHLVGDRVLDEDLQSDLGSN